MGFRLRGRRAIVCSSAVNAHCCRCLLVAVDILGFHGDAAELALVSFLCSKASPVGVAAFVETGTFYGASLLYMMRTYPHLQAFHTSELLPHVHAASVAATRSVIILKQYHL